MQIATVKDLLEIAENLNPIQAKSFISNWVVDNEVNPKRNGILEELTKGDLFSQDLAIIAFQRIKDYKKIVEILLTTASQTVQEHATRSLIMVDPPPSVIRALVLELSNRMLSYLIHYILLKKKKEIAAAIFPLLVEKFNWDFATKLIAFIPKEMVEEYFLLLSQHLDSASESILYKNYQDVFLKFILEKLKECKSEDQLDLIEKQLRDFITPLLRYSEETEEIENFYKSYIKGTSLERFSPLFNKLWKEELTQTFPQFFPDSRSGSVLTITLEDFHKFFNNSSIYTIWNASPEYPLEFKNQIYRCAILDGKPEVINFYSNEPEVVFRQFDNLMPKILMKWDEYFKGAQVPKEFEKGLTEYEVKYNQLANIKMHQVPLCFVNKYAEELYLLLKEKPEISKNRGFTIYDISRYLSLNTLWDELIVQTKDPSEPDRIEAYRKFITLFLSEIQAEEKRLKLEIQVNQNLVNKYYRELYSNKKAMYLQLERVLKVFLSAQNDEKNVRFQNLITLQRIPNRLFIEDHFPILEQIIDGAMENAETSLGRQDQLRILIMNFIRYGNKDFPNLYSFGIEILNKYSQFLYQHPHFWKGFPLYHQENYEFVKDKIYTKIRECIVDNQIKETSTFEKFIFLISDYWESDTHIKDWLEQYIFTNSELRSDHFIERWITHGIQPYLNRQARRTKEIERIQRLLDYNKKYISVPLIYLWVFNFQTQFVDEYLQGEDKDTIIEIINSHPRYIKSLSHSQKNIIFNWLLEKRESFNDVSNIEEIQNYTKLILKYPLQSQVLIEKWNPMKSQDITTFNLNLSSLAVIDYFYPNIIFICLDKLKSLHPAYFPTALNVLLKICNRVPSFQRDRLLEHLIPSLMNIPLKNQLLEFDSLNIVKEYMPKSAHQPNQNDVDQDLEKIIENYRMMKNLGNVMDKYELKLDLSNQTEANTLIINEHGQSFLNKCESALTYGYMNQLLDLQCPKKYISNIMFQKSYIVPFFPRYNAYVKKLIEKSLDRNERIKTTPDGKEISESYSNMYSPIDIGFYYLLPTHKDLFLPHVLCEDKVVLNWVYEYSVRGWFIDHKEDVYNQLVSVIMNPNIEFELRTIYFNHLLGYAYSEQYSERVYLKILKLIEMEKERLKSNSTKSRELFPKTSEFRDLIEKIFQYYTNYNLKFISHQKIGTIFKLINQDELLRSQFDLRFRFTYSLIAERSIENLDAFVKDTLENHPDYPYFDYYLINELNSLIIHSFYNSKDLIIPWTQSKLENMAEGKESDIIHFFILQLVADLSTHQYYKNEDWIPYLSKIKENGNAFTKFLIDKLEFITSQGK